MADLIDRAKVLADIERDIENSGCVNHEREIMDCVRYAPTVDAEVVRHGYWTEENNFNEAMRIGDYQEWFECSLCGGQEGRESEWCPHCGAKMDAKE